MAKRPQGLTTNQGHSSRPELFFAFVRPTGCAGDEVTAALSAELSRVGYALARVVKVSKLLHSLEKFSGLKRIPIEDERIERHMDAGDELREQFFDNAALAYLAVEEIAKLRTTSQRSRAWLIDSLKHPDEIDLLREIYGNNLVVVSIYSDEAVRRKALARLITKTRGSSTESESRAQRLIVRDQQGADASLEGIGQDVRRAFAKADYFITASKDVREQTARLIETLFGRPTRSPSRDEYGMAVAQSAAFRSADLSRQVGAVIVDEEGEVLVAGCNEVPKPGGGVYWEGDPQDSRDFVYEFDPNEETSREMLVELFDRLRQHDWLSADLKECPPADIARRAIDKKILKTTRVASLVEFGRIVHAEMNAVLRAAAGGIRIRGMRMICTTFPCHVCARHLLGAGLSEVVYIEPYPKSLAPEQYPNTIVVGEKAGPGVLQCRPFVGWAPARYTRIFRFGKRKSDSGHLQRWDGSEEKPKTGRDGNPHLELEPTIIKIASGRLRLAGLNRISSASKTTRTHARKGRHT